MAEARARQIIIAGAGVAGLTAALSFAVRGHPVRIFERAQRLEEVGAGIQLSPNATRILDRLGVLSSLRQTAVRPDAVVLRDASSLAELGRVPLGAYAELRWKAPYLTAHRADLQAALLAHVEREPGIELTTGATVRDIAPHPLGVSVVVDSTGRTTTASGMMLVAADGVWSSLRRLTCAEPASRFSGQVAWRRTVRADSAAGRALAQAGVGGSVTAFLAPGFHLVTYPVRAGAALNIVAFTPGKAIGETWAGNLDIGILKRSMRRAAPALLSLADDIAEWTVWPIHTVRANAPWTTEQGIALIGDAAHAMPPYAAQGAAMAIEDAEMLAGEVQAHPDSLKAALAAWETERRLRIERVARQGRLNRFTWHAAGPAALARNLFLRTRRPEKLAARFDWLYGWTPPPLKL
ncbi:FAD-dependent monooxygenase [Mesorhizobium marinum]|uniref:FAD-dependent monooxygenase n=1 Tax=Mesorhizobium marinum TaxID=3228790 RepID=UPI0034672524